MLLLLLFIYNPKHLVLPTTAPVAGLAIYSDGVEVAKVTLAVVSQLGLLQVVYGVRAFLGGVVVVYRRRRF